MSTNKQKKSITKGSGPSNTQITNVKITETFGYDETLLKKVLTIMEKNGVQNPKSMLPYTPHHVVQFELKNTHSRFSNAIRRVLLEELPVKCLTFEDEDWETDDHFILSDMLMKNVNLIPINQEHSIDLDKTSIYLYKYNNTNDIMQVKASDIQISSKKKKGSAEDDADDDVKYKYAAIKDTTSQGNANLIPHNNVTIINLRPGKFIKIKKFNIISGQGKTDAAKFTLLDNIRYEILDMEPYDIFTRTGTRSTEYDPKEFRITYTTTGNINPITVMQLLNDYLSDKLTKMKNKIIEFANTEKKETDKQYYYTDGLEVEINNNMRIYKFVNEYITLPNMIAQRCYLIDPNITLCIPTIDRYDNEIGIIRINHPDPNKVMISAIDECMKDIDTIYKTIYGTKITKE